MVFITNYLFFGLLLKANGFISTTNQINLIKSISDDLNIKTVLILTNNLNEPGHIIIQKELNNLPQLFTGVWTFKKFIKNIYSDEIITMKTLIIMHYTNNSLNFLHSVSNADGLAFYDWLIFSNSDEKNFKNLIIPVNCRFLVAGEEQNGVVLINEVYKLSKNSELIINEYGNWSFEKGFINILDGDIFGRRINLRNHTFLFAVHNMSIGINPCKTIQVDNGKQMIQCAYYDVWRDLGRKLNFSTKYVVIEDCYKNGSTGISTPMLEMIRTGGADSGEDGYIWSSSRLIHNQFFWPLFHSKVILVTKIPSRKFSFWSYVRPFDNSMWFALGTSLLLSGVVLTIIKLLTERSYKSLLFFCEIIENFLLPLKALCYQSSTSIPNKAAIRIAYLIIYILPVLLIPSYSGSIKSSLSVPTENIPFYSLEEFEKDGTYQLNAINNTFFQFFLMTDDKFEILRQKKLISSKITISYDESFKDICKEKVTFIYEWPLLTKYSIHCNVFKFELSLKKIFSSMAVRKNFPFLELFNRQIQKLITSGLNMKILEKNTLKLFKHKVNPFPKNHFQIKPFGLEDVLPLFIILTTGLVLSVVLLIFEKQMNLLPE